MSLWRFMIRALNFLWITLVLSSSLLYNMFFESRKIISIIPSPYLISISTVCLRTLNIRSKNCNKNNQCHLNAKILTRLVFIKWSRKIYILIFNPNTQIQKHYFSVLNTSTQHKLNYCKTANFENVDIPIEESPFRYPYKQTSVSIN